MLRQGLAMLLQANPAVASIAPVAGFGFGELPKGLALPTWIFTMVSDKENYTLAGRAGLSSCTIQIDALANSPEEAIRLGDAIDSILSGYRGTLPDPDATGIDSCFRTNRDDHFDDAPRGYRCMLEYQVWVYEK